MKKLLLSLAAVSLVSAASIAADLNFGSAPTAETTIFNSGQAGRIAVTGRVVSEETPSMVAYTIFATNDNGVSNFQDTLILPDYQLNSESAGKGGFLEQAPWVKVARVNGSKDGITPLLDSEKATYNIINPDNYSPTSATPEDITVSSNRVTYMITSLFSKAELERIVQSSGMQGDKTLTPNNTGRLIVGNKEYVPSTLLEFSIDTTSSVMSIKTIPNPNFDSTPNRMSTENSRLFEKAFNGTTLNNVFIQAKIGA